MKNRNLLLNIATYVLRAGLGILILVFAVIVIIMIHWHLDKSFYEQLYLMNGFQSGTDSFNLILSSDKLTNVSLADLSSSMLIWQGVRTLIFVGLAIYSVWIYLKIFKSIRNLKTFYDDNIRSFRILAWIGLVASGFAFFNFGELNGEWTWNYTIPFRPLIFSVISLVLSEVFKEGKNLQEETKSFI